MITLSSNDCKWIIKTKSYWQKSKDVLNLEQELNLNQIGNFWLIMIISILFCWVGSNLLITSKLAVIIEIPLNIRNLNQIRNN